jgi:hypothetical protein
MLQRRRTIPPRKLIGIHPVERVNTQQDQQCVYVCLRKTANVKETSAAVSKRQAEAGEVIVECAYHVELVILSLNANGAQDLLDVSSRGLVVATEGSQKVSSYVPHATKSNCERFRSDIRAINGQSRTKWSNSLML